MKVTNKYLDITGKSILRGKIDLAPDYKIQGVEEYKGNPLIEALPPIFSPEYIYEEFTHYPEISEEEKNMRVEERYHVLERVKTFSQVLNVHFYIQNKLSTILRQGYIPRNIADQDYLARLRYINSIRDTARETKEANFRIIEAEMRSTAKSFSIIGISGIGKTTALEKLLLMYPQVIIHSSYKGKPLMRTQIVWLKIDCPFDGSLKTLCTMFFRALDDVLGNTEYYRKFGNGRDSTATMMINMTYLAAQYSIGVLVIDEIQHLIASKKDSADEFLNFYVTLTNTIGIPVLLIGTFKAHEVLTQDFRQARRAGGSGSIIWDRMDKKSEDWNIFIEYLWGCWCLKNTQELTEEIKDVMYNESQGISAVAVNLFILAQESAMRNGIEKITPKILRETAKKELGLIANMIDALRSGDIKKIMKYEDLAYNLDEVLRNVKHERDLHGIAARLAKTKKAMRDNEKIDIKNQVINALMSFKIFDGLGLKKIDAIIEEVIKKLGTDNKDEVQKEVLKKCIEQKDALDIAKEEKNSKKNKKTAKLQNRDLRRVYEESQKKKVPIYDLLSEAGFIKNPLEEFWGEEKHA
jgi:hypothetical protein